MSEHIPFLSVYRRQTWLTCLLFMFSLWGVGLAQSTQVISIVALTNGADFQPGLPQPGSLASLFCTGLQGAPGVISATQYPLSNQLSDISVWINSIPAPILSIAFQEGYQQINFQVPWEVQGTTPPLDVEVSQYGEQSHTMNTQTNGFSVFFADANGYGLIRHASDHLLVETQNPAHPGENLIAYGINLGPVASTPPDGAVSAVEAQSLSVASFNTCYVDHSVRIETITTVPSYVGLSPGTVGVYQVDFQLPSTVSVGDLPLTIERTIWSNPFGQCLGNRSNESTQTFVSRSVLLPIQ